MRQLLIAATVFVLVACDGTSDPLCVPGASVACVGPGGCMGGQVCADDGASYAECICTAADAGIDSGSAATDAGSDAATDAGITLDAGSDGGASTDAGPGVRVAVGVGSSRASLAAADYGCGGTRTAPARGASSSFTIVATDFFNGMPVSGLNVQLFGDDVPSPGGTCTGSCQASTTAVDGTAAATGDAGGWFAYRIRAGAGTISGVSNDYVQVVQSHALTPSTGGSATLNAISRSTLNTIAALLSVSQQASRSLIIGMSTDCAGDPVANADIRLFDASGPLPYGTASTDTRPFYFNGASVPSRRETTTNVDGLYGVSNVPVPAGSAIRVELWGSLTDGGPTERLGCEQALVAADGITILDVGPSRADGPVVCTGP